MMSIENKSAVIFLQEYAEIKIKLVKPVFLAHKLQKNMEGLKYFINTIQFLSILKI